MKTYAILRRSGWANAQELSKAAARSTHVGQHEMPERVRWLRSYVLSESDGQVGTVCIYQAVDENAVREHARRAELPCDEVIPVADCVVITPETTL